MGLPTTPDVANADLVLNSSWGGTTTKYTTEERSDGYGTGTTLGRIFASINKNYENAYTFGWIGWLVAAVNYLAQTGELYTDSGTANNFILSIASGTNPTSYTNGLRVRFFANHTNTNTCTVNVNSIGSKNVKTISGENLTSGVITEGQYIELVYDSDNDCFIWINGKYANINGNPTQTFNVANATASTHAVPLGQLNSLVSVSNYPSYCANSGNTDTNGYADIIHKESDTEISFKVGGSYSNLGVTFPNGKHYTISSISNITGISSDATYIFVLYEDNLSSNGDGTYSAIVDKVSLGYSSYGGKILPVMTSNTQDGITLSGTSGTADYYKLTDEDVNTALLDGFHDGEYLQIQLPSAKAVWRLQFATGYNYNADNRLAAGVLQGSNNGSSWTTIWSGSVDDTYMTLITVDFTPSSAYSYFRFYSTGSSDTLWCASEFNLFEYAGYDGGNITEGYVLPISPSSGDLNLLINQNPMKPQLYNGSTWRDRQFVKLGKGVKATTLTVTNYAFNGQFIGSIGTESTIGSDYYYNTLNSGNKLYKRAF